MTFVSASSFPVARTRNRLAMTLVEIMIAITIGGLVLAAIGTLFTFTLRSFAAIGNYNDLDNASRNALDVLSRDVRQAHVLTAFTPNQIRLVANDSNTLIYTYTPATREFTRQHGSSTTLLLKQCDYLNFAIYQRNPSNGWAWYPVSSNLLLTTKLIDVSWKCSREMFGEKVHTESVQTAKFVIRN